MAQTVEVDVGPRVDRHQGLLAHAVRDHILLDPRHRQRAGRLGYFFTLTVMYMLLNWLPSLLLEQGFSKPQASLVQVLFNIGGALGSLLGGLLLDRCNGIKVVLFVYAGLLAALAGVGLSLGIVPMAVAGFAAGLFVMAAQLVLYALAPPSYPTSVRATGVGAAVAIGRLGSVTGPLAAGQILAAGAGTTGVLLAASPGLVIAALTIIGVIARAAPLNVSMKNAKA